MTSKMQAPKKSLLGLFARKSQTKEEGERRRSALGPLELKGEDSVDSGLSNTSNISNTNSEHGNASSLKPRNDEIPILDEDKTVNKEYKGQLGEYKIQKMIGKGGFAKVYMVRKKADGMVYAMKVMRKEHVRKMKQVN
jgi:hypothetical protein